MSSSVINIRLNDAERELLTQIAVGYDGGISALIKKLAFDKLEDEYDLNIIEQYEKNRENGTLETRSITELWQELGL